MIWAYLSSYFFIPMLPAGLYLEVCDIIYIPPISGSVVLLHRKKYLLGGIVLRPCLSPFNLKVESCILDELLFHVCDFELFVGATLKMLQKERIAPTSSGLRQF